MYVEGSLKTFESPLVVFQKHFEGFSEAFGMPYLLHYSTARKDRRRTLLALRLASVCHDSVCLEEAGRTAPRAVVYNFS